MAGTLGETPLFTNVRYLALTGNPLDALLPCTKTLVPCSWHHFLQNKHRAQTLDQGKRNLILPTFPSASGLNCYHEGVRLHGGYMALFCNSQSLTSLVTKRLVTKAPLWVCHWEAWPTAITLTIVSKPPIKKLPDGPLPQAPQLSSFRTPTLLT